MPTPEKKYWSTEDIVRIVNSDKPIETVSDSFARTVTRLLAREQSSLHN